jgi:hypothetical protein
VTDHDDRSREGSTTGCDTSPRRLETDADVVRVLQQRYPLVDDPAAREAIVALGRDGRSGRQRQLLHGRSWGALALVAGMLVVLLWKRIAVARMVRRHS